MTTSQQSDDQIQSAPAEATEHDDVQAQDDTVEARPAEAAAPGGTAAPEEPASQEPQGEEPAGQEPQGEEPTTPEAQAEEPAAQEPQAEEPAPAPSPAPVPGPKPGGRVPSPAAVAHRPAQPAAPVVPAPPSYSTPLDEAAKFARVAEDGHVFVLIGGEEHPVGQYPDASPEEALAYFVRKHDDVVSQLLLLEQRVAAKAPAGDMTKTLDHLAEQVAERGMVGDLAALEARIETVRGEVAQLQRAERKAHEEQRTQELAAREAIVAEAEELAAKDPANVQWKQGSNRMNELFEQWKGAQKHGVRLGRSTEDALWKRFRSARTTFDRHRRAFFSQLDADNSEAKAAKEALIARAEALSSSTDWGHTAGEYRRLMDEWKASKRASRKDDDALWARFRAAQDVFFNARQAANDALDQEFAGNLAVKEQILAEAKSLLPIKDLAAAKKALDSIRDRWDAAGKVPRADMQRMESGLRQVEEAVRSAEDEQWRRSNPETKARTNSMLTQLEDTIAQLESELEAARAGGNERSIRTAEEALEARRSWLETLQRSAQDFQ
ncbi:DUF349 domain-containing protein [Zafaria sp. J156]|uniref:DUF349 domain-containing protein n=1 Tax=Zafaria sp. J156 TaxID=3116490 RepID=UPI002E7A8E70|nr:DUF349 domain-containing protein [Zafaria sp. J156]MEE1621108.1 DUF349 domain-containing protein [Zafaria sp. J156]